MDNLIVKQVDVLGDCIIATKDEEGNIWAGVSYFCKALGMNKGQKDRQTTNVQKDETLKRGCRKFAAGIFDNGSEAIGMRIDFIPLWLAKISITPTMLKDHPELAEKLLDYQLKAKDILAEAFIPKQNIPSTTQEQIKLLAQGNVELNQRVDEVSGEVNSLKEDFENFKRDLPLLPAEADDVSNAVKKKGVEVLGGKQSRAYNDRCVRQRVYNDLYYTVKRNFNTRSYKNIRRKDVDKAIGVVERYVPPLFLEEQIAELNR